MSTLPTHSDADGPGGVPDRLEDVIIRVSSSEWFVRSRKSAPGAYWRVQTFNPTLPLCGCPANHGVRPGDMSRNARACHHARVAIDFEIKRDRLLHPRPTAPPHPGLVDD